MKYLACPYSHPEPSVREIRFQAVTDLAASKVAAGEHILSPITHGHALAMTDHKLPMEFEYWEALCKKMIDACDEVMVLTLEGWKESVGVQAEIRYAVETGKPVSYI
ncbi:MAG: DUF1937 family protein [Gammaproteobacteria bacterium]|nr:DUF1937 family protein [Gammaproteobacteria bacterium]